MQLVRAAESGRLRYADPEPRRVLESRCPTWILDVALLSHKADIRYQRDAYHFGQCDEGRPKCSRCRAWDNCVYQDPFEARHRSQTQRTAKAVLERKRAQRSGRALAAVRSPALPQEHLVLGRLRYEIDGFWGNIMKLQWQHCFDAPTGSLSRLAVAAAAELIFAQRYAVPKLKLAATAKHAEVLKRLRANMHSRHYARSNDVMATIAYAAMYEASRLLRPCRVD